jgi:hypothetical protein
MLARKIFEVFTGEILCAALAVALCLILGDARARWVAPLLFCRSESAAHFNPRCRAGTGSFRSLLSPGHYPELLQLTVTTSVAFA